MGRRNILTDVKKKTALLAGGTGEGLAAAGALSARGANVISIRRGGEPARDLTVVLAEMAAQVRLLSATIELILDELD
jgi:NAD(P)-dependent dehydrogenase (short-subunit alcohol dehydrogenase family)